MELNDYVGIPYQSHGRTWAGCDCWGLVRLWLLEQRNIQLPAWTAEYKDAKKAVYARLAADRSHYEGWEKLEKPRIGCVGEFDLGGIMHVGICAHPKGREILHIVEGCNSVIEPIITASWQNCLKGWWDYVR